MNIFITGVAGFIGGSVAHRLMADRHSIRGLVRDPEKAQALAAIGIAWPLAVSLPLSVLAAWFALNLGIRAWRQHGRRRRREMEDA